MEACADVLLVFLVNWQCTCKVACWTTLGLQQALGEGDTCIGGPSTLMLCLSANTWSSARLVAARLQPVVSAVELLRLAVAVAVVVS